jgi:hypothetical protein
LGSLQRAATALHLGAAAFIDFTPAEFVNYRRWTSAAWPKMARRAAPGLLADRAALGESVQRHHAVPLALPCKAWPRSYARRSQPCAVGTVFPICTHL